MARHIATWEGSVLRGTIAHWDTHDSSIPKLPGSDIFSTGEWKVHAPFTIPEFQELRLVYGPTLVVDLSVTFIVKAPAELGGLADVVAGPFNIPSSNKAGELFVRLPDLLMRVHHCAKSNFEMVVSCPSRGILPPPPTIPKWSEKGAINPRFVADYVAALSLSAQPFDLQLKFPASGQTLWVNSSILKQASSHWKIKLEANSTSTAPVSMISSTQSTYQPDSSQLDQAKEVESTEVDWSDSDNESVTQVGSPGPEQPIHSITITNHSFSTYHAVWVWILTKQIHFASLKSSVSRATDATPASADVEPPQKRRRVDVATPSAAPVVSPKSVYRLAQALDIRSLQQKALDAFKAGLTVDNVAHELFSSTANDYEEIRAAAAEFAASHWSEVEGRKTMEEALAKVKGREVDQGGVNVLSLAMAFAAKILKV